MTHPDSFTVPLLYTRLSCDSSACVPGWLDTWRMRLSGTQDSSLRCPSREGLPGQLPRAQLQRSPELRGAGGASASCTFPESSSPQGSPKPQASWTHDGHALDAQRVNVRTGDQDSILFIRSAQRSDSGCYELTMRLEGLEAKAAIDILVIGTGPGEAGLPGWDLETPPPTRADADGTGPGSVTGAQSWGWRFCGKPWHPPHPPSRSGPAEKPGPPSSIRLLDVWGCNAALEWMPPQDTGNTELLGYTVQKADRKTGVRLLGPTGGEATKVAPKAQPSKSPGAEFSSNHC